MRCNTFIQSKQCFLALPLGLLALSFVILRLNIPYICIYFCAPCFSNNIRFQSTLCRKALFDFLFVAGNDENSLSLLGVFGNAVELCAAVFVIVRRLAGCKQAHIHSHLKCGIFMYVCVFSFCHQSAFILFDFIRVLFFLFFCFTTHFPACLQLF